jgi:hypothetical protein
MNKISNTFKIYRAQKIQIYYPGEPRPKQLNRPTKRMRQKKYLLLCLIQLY